MASAVLVTLASAGVTSSNAVMPSPSPAHEATTTTQTPAPASLTEPSSAEPTPAASPSEEPSSVPASAEPSAPSDAPSEDSAEAAESPEPDVLEESALAASLQWSVEDASGDPVPGATFAIEVLREGTWTPVGDDVEIADAVTDDEADTGLDADPEAGGFDVDTAAVDPAIAEAEAAAIESSAAESPAAEGSEAGSADAAPVTASPVGRLRVAPRQAPEGYAWADETARVLSAEDALAATSSRPSAFSLGTFAVQAVAGALQCGPGQVYSLTHTGQLQYTDPAGTVTKVGTLASSNSMNGLGIGASGTEVYAYARTNGNQSATLHRYDVTTGVWTSTGLTVNSSSVATNVQFVAGGVNLQNGKYYFGGFNNVSGTQGFHLWEYDPSANRVTYKGLVPMDFKPSTELWNGDLAFDALGNMFIVRGVRNTRVTPSISTTLHTVTAADVAAANGGSIRSSTSSSFATSVLANGIAFDSDGAAYIGDNDALTRFTMPGWTSATLVTSALSSTSGSVSQDLATCSSPPTITVQKVMGGQRVKSDDQFGLKLTQGSTTLAEATTTTGSATGVQPGQIGPFPTVRGTTLTFSESAAGTTTLADYTTTWRCEVDGVQTVSGTGATGTISIPATGKAAVCQITNTPLITAVTIKKTVLDYQDQNPRPGAGWSMTARPTATSGTVVSNPTAPTQVTNAQGVASWNLTFGATSARARVDVSETQQQGFAFVRGTCTITGTNGQTRTTTTLNSANTTALAGVAPGERVDCEYVNRVVAGTLTLSKRLDSQFDPRPGVDQWSLRAEGPTSGISGVTGAAAVTRVQAAPGEYRLSEALLPAHAAKEPGYRPVSLTCTDQASGAISTVTLDNPRVVLQAGRDVACVFTNRDLPAAAAWTKVDEAGGAPLAGSEWTLTGPSFPNGTTITGSAQGAFNVTGLVWGTYQLREVKAPVGYRLSSQTRTITVGPDTPAGLRADLGALTNAQQRPLTLPLTGGTGSDLFWIGGGGMIALATLAALWRRRRGAAMHRG